MSDAADAHQSELARIRQQQKQECVGGVLKMLHKGDEDLENATSISVPPREL